MSVEALKEQARRHEQREEWKQALSLYQRAIEQLTTEEAPDVALHNRVGDLYIRSGDVTHAMEHFERAVALYLDAELPNNAIAVCKKMLRNVPDRSEVFLTMGRIRAGQGLFTDARDNFLAYVERMRAVGNPQQGLSALAELAALAADDPEIQLFVADQLERDGRGGEALGHLRAAWQGFTARGDTSQARSLSERIAALAPSAPLVAGDTDPPEGAVELPAPESLRNADDLTGPEEIEIGAEFGEIVTEGDEVSGSRIPEADVPESGTEPVTPLPGLEGAWPFGHEGEALTLEPAVPAGERDEGADVVPEEDVPLPLLHLPDEDEPPETGGSVEDRLEAGDLEGAERLLAARILRDPGDPEPRQLLIEVAFRRGDPTAQVEAYLGLARCLEELGEGAKARSVYVQVLRLDPDNGAALASVARADGAHAPPQGGVASSDQYVDLGALILGEADEDQATRLRVPYEQPSLDESADFERMLRQFTTRISETLPTGDVRSHYDLGTAYKEMGLLDEAIDTFEAALSADPAHLPSHELLGQCLLEKGQDEEAIERLLAATRIPVDVEDELLGIFYALGLAYERVGRRAEALELYDRVFALDINFLDVTERLRALR